MPLKALRSIEYIKTRLVCTKKISTPKEPIGKLFPPNRLSKCCPKTRRTATALRKSRFAEDLLCKTQRLSKK